MNPTEPVSLPTIAQMERELRLLRAESKRFGILVVENRRLAAENERLAGKVERLEELIERLGSG